MSNDHKKIASASAAEPLGAELERLLQPTHYLQHPRDVVRDAILTTAEKRAILSSWASDACAIESVVDERNADDGDRHGRDGHLADVNGADDDNRADHEHQLDDDNDAMKRRIVVLLASLVLAGGITWGAPADATAAGGDNAAIAINTKDGSSIFKFAFAAKLSGEVSL